MFSVLTSKIFGGVAIGSLLLLGVQTARLSSANERVAELTDWQNDVVGATRIATGVADLAVAHVPVQIYGLGASVDQLQRGIERQNSDVIARADALAEARQKAAQDAQTAAAAYRDTARQIGALRAAVGQNQGDDCATPPLEGL